MSVVVVTIVMYFCVVIIGSSYACDLKVVYCHRRLLTFIIVTDCRDFAVMYVMVIAVVVDIVTLSLSFTNIIMSVAHPQQHFPQRSPNISCTSPHVAACRRRRRRRGLCRRLARLDFDSPHRSIVACICVSRLD